MRDLDLKDADDKTIWDFARSSDWVIVSKDGDFHQLSLLFGPPPKVIWIRAGNASTSELSDLLRRRLDDVRAFVSGDGALLLLSP